MEISPIPSRLPGVRPKGQNRPVPSPAPAQAPAESFMGGLERVETIRLPKLVEPAPEDLKRGYLWNAVPLPGPIDAIIGAVVSFGPVPGWLGLEPAPTGFPNPQPLGFSWNGADAEAFGQHAQRLEGLLRDPQATEIGKRPVKGGSNANYLVTLNNGVSAMWTPAAQEKSPKDSRPNIPTGTQAQREEAAFLVDRHLGHLGRVPPRRLERTGRPTGESQVPGDSRCGPKGWPDPRICLKGLPKGRTF